MDDVVIPWAFGGTRLITHSLTHSITHSIDANFINLTDHGRTLYLLRLNNDNSSQVITKYAHLMFKKRKQILSQKSN